MIPATLAIAMMLSGSAGTFDSDAPAPGERLELDDIAPAPSLVGALAAQSPFDMAWSIGPSAGFLKARDADEGTWFGGVQARLRAADYFGAEGSITFHQDEFLDGDIQVTQYPVEVTGLLFPMPSDQFEWYVLGGAGWHYTRYDYSGALAGTSDEVEHIFGVHVGVGAELSAGTGLSINADIRYIFLEPDEDAAEDEEFDYWQISLGLNLRI